MCKKKIARVFNVPHYAEDMAHGGARPGAGRKALPEGKKRANVTIKVRPVANRKWAKLAKDAKTSKAGVVEWLAEADTASGCRNEAVKYARQFLHPEG